LQGLLIKTLRQSETAQACGDGEGPAFDLGDAIRFSNPEQDAPATVTARQRKLVFCAGSWHCFE